MRDEEEFTDMTLACEDCQLGEAHKVILAGPSSQKNIQTHWSDSDDLSWSNKLSAYLEQVIAQRNMMNNFWEMRLSPDTNIVEPC